MINSSEAQRNVFQLMFHNKICKNGWYFYKIKKSC